MTKSSDPTPPLSLEQTAAIRATLRRIKGALWGAGDLPKQEPSHVFQPEGERDAQV